MHARWLAVLIGTSLGGLVFSAGWWLKHRPTPTQEMGLRVVDARGQPVDRFGWMIWDETPGAMLDTTTQVGMHAGGIATLQVPAHELTLEIESPGLRRARLGPFHPDAMPTRLEARLEDLGVVEGVVRRDGIPVAGASVGLFREGWKRWNDEKSGLFYGFKEERSETDASGVFRIPSDSDRVELWVRAWKEGSACGTAGPVQVGAPPIQVAMHDGGTLEGHLTVGPERVAGSCEVELYRREPRDDREPSTFEYFHTAVGSAGSFAFEHVETGPWLVRLKPSATSRRAPAGLGDEHVPFLVAIEDQKTCHLEMDLLQPPLRLIGHVTMNGRPWNPSWPSLFSTGEKSLELDSAEADANGNWTLRTRAAGRYQLFIGGNHHHDTSVPARAWGEVELQRGETRFERSLEWSETDPPDVRLDRNR